MLKGLTWQSLRTNYSLIPLFSVVTLGLVLAAGQSIHCLIWSPDIKGNRRNTDRPWDSKVNDDGTFKHSKYVKIHDYNKLRRSEYEPDLD